MKIIKIRNPYPCDPTKREFPKDCGHCDCPYKPCLGQNLRRIVLDEREVKKIWEQQ